MTKLLQCSKCKQEKDPSCFHNNKARHSGKSAYCIDCDRERKRAYKNTEKGKASQRRRSERYRRSRPESIARSTRKDRDKKQALINEFKSRGCASCGYNRCPEALDLHHRDDAIKEGNLSNMVYNCGIDRIKSELEKCEVLCANCHREHHAGFRQKV